MELKKFRYISEKRLKDFEKLGIDTVEGLCRHFPRDYLDLTHTSLIREAYNNERVLTLCEVLNVETLTHTARPFVKATCQQGGYIFTAIWFHQPYVAKTLQSGEYLFYGRVQNRNGLVCSMVNPTFERADRNMRLKGLIPVYPLSGSLTQTIMRNAVTRALDAVMLQSRIPAALQKKYSLMPLAEAYRQVHSPQNRSEAAAGAERIAIEEYFLLVSAFKVMKGDKREARINKYTVTREQLESFISRFPFEFTAGQRAATEAIFSAVHSPYNMNRLLQGDVGCGKTAVALAGIYMAVKSGYQAAMIAPTEVLAQQNAKLIEEYFPDFCCYALTGAMTVKQKHAVKRALVTGEIEIICGTHALLQEDVVFRNLAFVVCDEQHRFGVAQRASLTSKGEGCDVLVMSATPIPRTLSLIFYGDLDITTIRDKPTARQQVTTAIIPRRKREAMYEYVMERAGEGEQTYFVCPKIEGDEEGTAMSVTELYEELQTKLEGLRLALLHGRMNDKKKNEIMDAFRAGEYDCLVSTTVIEVGVDVPDATTMIIYNAERFGLSQLHQLRGRVGRGEKKSYCFLLTDSDTEETRERLSVIKTCSDGFEVAEEDLRIRGGGDFMGTRQSGRMMSELKNLKFPVRAVFTAKKISDEAFSGSFDTRELTSIVAEKYESLKNITLN